MVPKDALWNLPGCIVNTTVNIFLLHLHYDEIGKIILVHYETRSGQELVIKWNFKSSMHITF